MTGDGMGPPFNRAVLVEVLTYHQRVSPSHCACGWSVLGASFADHMADVYEASVMARG